MHLLAIEKGLTEADLLTLKYTEKMHGAVNMLCLPTEISVLKLNIALSFYFTKFTEEEFVLRSRRGHDHHLAQIEEDPSCTSVYGVKQKSPLNKSYYFHVVDGLPSDIMHDLFEGVIPRHLKLLLHFFIVEMGFFTHNAE